MLGDSIRRRRGAARGEPGREEEAPDPERGEDRTPSRPEPEDDDRLLPWGRVAAGALAAALVLFAGGFLLASRVLYPPVEVSGASVYVPELTGLSADDARARLREAGLGTGEVTELPHPDASPGSVLAQAPLPGQGVRPGAAVRFAVSGGPARTPVPDLVGFPAATARDVLERAGMEVEVLEVEDPAPQGRVLSLDPSPGTRADLPATVTLRVSAGPPPDTLAPPDSVRVAVPPAIIPPLR